MGGAESDRPLTFGSQPTPNETGTLRMWYHDSSSFPCDRVIGVTDIEQLVTAAPSFFQAATWRLQTGRRNPDHCGDFRQL